jgi:hypothetical protein
MEEELEFTFIELSSHIASTQQVIHIISVKGNIQLSKQLVQIKLLLDYYSSNFNIKEKVRNYTIGCDGMELMGLVV